MKDYFNVFLNFFKPAALQMLLTGFVVSCSPSDKKQFDVLAEDKGFIQIPGVGWQTFFRTAPEDPTMNGLRFKSGCAYMRWTWGDLEPQEGQYAFAMIDDWLNRCRQAKQALAFRVMLSWPGHEGTIPQWLLDKGIKYTYSLCPEEGAHYEVDIEEPIVKQYHEKLIRALGERYDGHPNLALVDIGSVGLWRGDCWGNGPGPGVGWNEHKDSYWPMVNLMPDGWKTGTVALEPCGTLGGYPTSPKVVVDDAISWHATFVQNKSNYIPANWIPEIERLVMKLGFRLVLRNLTFDEVVAAGSEIPISMKWENLGIAPPYRDHRIAFRLRDKNGENHAVTITEMSIQGWLPGEKNITVNYKLPLDLQAENYNLEMGLVFHSSIEHTIPIANKGKTSDGWYTLGNLKVSQ